VGNVEFSKAFDRELGGITFRYVNNLDIVPHVPPAQLLGRPQLRAPTSVADFLRTIENAPREVKEAVDAVAAEEKFAHVGQLKLFLSDGSLTSGEVLHAKDRIIDHDPLKGYLPKLEAQVC